MVIVLVYLYFPFAALTLYASLERFDWDQLKAAMDLGASAPQAIRRVLLPQIRPGILTAAIFVFIPMLGEYLMPQLVGGTKGVMIGNLITNFFNEAQYTRGAAAALLIAAFIAVLLHPLPALAPGPRNRLASGRSQELDVVSPRRALARRVFALYGGVDLLLPVRADRA